MVTAVTDARRWRDAALCREVDPDLFYPDLNVGCGPYWAQVAVARSICARCTVRAACLDWATRIPGGVPYGIAGGMTDHERGWDGPLAHDVGRVTLVRPA